MTLLIANTFLDNPNKYTKVVHLDRDVTNNAVDNLKWVDNAEWSSYKNKPEFVKGVYVRCIQTGKIYHSITEASIDTGLSKATITNSCNGRTRWAKNYTTWEYLDEERIEKMQNKLDEEKEIVTDLEGEVWKPVPYKRFCDVYSISNMGRVKSHHSCKKEKLLEPIILTRKKERTETTLWPVNNLRLDNETQNISIPKLVAELFVPNPHKYTTIRPIDGNILNYKASNLEWYDDSKTKSERAQEIYDLYKDHMSSYKKPVRCIETGRVFESLKEAGRATSLSNTSIGRVCNGLADSCRWLSLGIYRQK